MLNKALAAALTIVDTWPEIVAFVVEDGLLIIGINLRPGRKHLKALYYYTSFSNKLIDQWCYTFSSPVLLNSLKSKLSSVRLIILLNECVNGETVSCNQVSHSLCWMHY